MRKNCWHRSSWRAHAIELALDIGHNPSEEVNGTKRRQKTSGADAPKAYVVPAVASSRNDREGWPRRSKAGTKYRRVKGVGEAVRALGGNAAAPLGDGGGTGMPTRYLKALESQTLGITVLKSNAESKALGRPMLDPKYESNIVGR